MIIETILARLEVVHRTCHGYMARCPAHDDRSPSLSISAGYRGILMNCWAGCQLPDVTAAIGLKVTDLFYDTLPASGRRMAKKPVAINRVALAFNYEMMALDYRLRSESFFQQAQHVDFSSLTEADQDRIIDQAGAAHLNLEGTERLEQVADGLRLRAFTRDDRRTGCRLNRVA